MFEIDMNSAAREAALKVVQEFGKLFPSSEGCDIVPLEDQWKDYIEMVLQYTRQLYDPILLERQYISHGPMAEDEPPLINSSQMNSSEVWAPLFGGDHASTVRPNDLRMAEGSDLLTMVYAGTLGSLPACSRGSSVVEYSALQLSPSVTVSPPSPSDYFDEDRRTAEAVGTVNLSQKRPKSSQMHKSTSETKRQRIARSRSSNWSRRNRQPRLTGPHSEAVDRVSCEGDVGAQRQTLRFDPNKALVSNPADTTDSRRLAFLNGIGGGESLLDLAMVLRESKELADQDAGRHIVRSVPEIIRTIRTRDDRILFQVLQQWLDVSMLYEKCLSEVCQQSSVTFHISTPKSLCNTSRKRAGNPVKLADAAIVTRIMEEFASDLQVSDPQYREKENQAKHIRKCGKRLFSVAERFGRSIICASLVAIPSETLDMNWKHHTYVS